MNTKPRPSGLVRALAAAAIGAAAGVGAAVVAVAIPPEPPVWGLLIWGVPTGVLAGAATGVVIWSIAHGVLPARSANDQPRAWVAIAAATVVSGAVGYFAFASAGAAVAWPVAAAASVLGLVGSWLERQPLAA